MHILTKHKRCACPVQRITCHPAILAQNSVAGILPERYAAAGAGFGASAACRPYRYHGKKVQQLPLRVELAKMLDIPGVAHWQAFFGLQADSARPGDSHYPIRAFPLRRQLVGILGRLNTPKNKVAFLKASCMNIAAMIVAQGLLVACSSHSSLKTIFLKERNVILPQLLLLKLIISEHSR